MTATLTNSICSNTLTSILDDHLDNDSASALEEQEISHERQLALKSFDLDFDLETFIAQEMGT